MGCVGAGSTREKGGKEAWYGVARRREGGSGRRAAAAAGRQQPGHSGRGRAGVAVQNRGGGPLQCGPHGTVPVGRVNRRSIDLKINLN
jgi:hypothetical protein